MGESRRAARGARLDERRPGSGLGLAIVDELVLLYGGNLTLDDAKPRGLRASVVLPLARNAPPAVAD
ncbi:ATP-binding protein [Halotalea alkalilenta]|uniref:ATP-binding protein n=1 Tax=Halotalea alkalilenta TaxID=376489 RepID=UPI00316AECBB